MAPPVGEERQRGVRGDRGGGLDEERKALEREPPLLKRLSVLTEEKWTWG